MTRIVNWSRYTREELVDLWRNFRHQRNAVEMLQAFGLMDQYQAQMLNIEFWREYSSKFKGPDSPVFPQAKIKESDFMW